MTKPMKIAREVALEAGEYIARRIGKVREVGYKGEINVVTDIDKGAEALIVKKLLKAFPDHGFIAEENTYPPGDSEYRWIIDPLDGTTNFLHAFPFFCVSIAMMKGEELIVGVVYDPVAKELFTAEKGRGAKLNGKRIAVSKIRKLNASLLATGFAYDVKKARNNNIGTFTRFLKKAQGIRRAGSAALDLCYVACGRFDGFWELNLQPWDTAAGVLILTEAGGRVTSFDGSKYSIFDSQLLSSNGTLHKTMIRVLEG